MPNSEMDAKPSKLTFKDDSHHYILLFLTKLFDFMYGEFNYENKIQMQINKYVLQLTFEIKCEDNA